MRLALLGECGGVIASVGSLLSKYRNLVSLACKVERYCLFDPSVSSSVYN